MQGKTKVFVAFLLAQLHASRNKHCESPNSAQIYLLNPLIPNLGLFHLIMSWSYNIDKRLCVRHYGPPGGWATSTITLPKHKTFAIAISEASETHILAIAGAVQMMVSDTPRQAKLSITLRRCFAIAIRLDQLIWAKPLPQSALPWPRIHELSASMLGHR